MARQQRCQDFPAADHERGTQRPRGNPGATPGSSTRNAHTGTRRFPAAPRGWLGTQHHRAVPLAGRERIEASLIIPVVLARGLGSCAPAPGIDEDLAQHEANKFIDATTTAEGSLGAGSLRVGQAVPVDDEPGILLAVVVSGLAGWTCLETTRGGSEPEASQADALIGQIAVVLQRGRVFPGLFKRTRWLNSCRGRSAMQCPAGVSR